MIYYANCPFCENEFSFDGTEAIDDLMRIIYYSDGRKSYVYNTPCPHCGVKVIVSQQKNNKNR